MTILQRIIDYLSKIQTQISGISVPTASQNADAVWDEATSGHAVSGSTGKALTDILAGVGGSIPAEVGIIEDHIHPTKFGYTGLPSTLTTITASGTPDTFGSWTQVCAAANLPAVGKYFDVHQSVCRQATINTGYYVELGYGDGTPGGTVTVGQFGFFKVSAAAQENPIFHGCSRILSNGSSNLYARSMTDTGGTRNFYYYGFWHEYP